MMDTHSCLVAARNHLDRVGWRSYGEGAWPRSGTCALGALKTVALDQSCVPAGEVLARLGGLADVYQVAVWNDAPGRTKQEVLGLFDRAIQATAPAPPFESLGQEPATAREPINESVFA